MAITKNIFFASYFLSLLFERNELIEMPLTYYFEILVRFQ